MEGDALDHAGDLLGSAFWDCLGHVGVHFATVGRAWVFVREAILGEFDCVEGYGSARASHKPRRALGPV